MRKSKAKLDGGARRRGGHSFSRMDEAVQWFEREDFEPAEYIGLLQSEKELGQARNELAHLNEHCKQEVQKVVHNHHKDFLEASRDIQDVEALVDELRNYVSGSAAVVASLVDLPPLPKQISINPQLLQPTAALGERPGGREQQQPASAWEGILAVQAELMQDLQVAVAEQDFVTARALLNAGRDMVAVVDRDAAQLAAQAGGDALPAWRHALEGALAAQKAQLIEELQRQLSRTNSSTSERRQAAQTLGLLVGPAQAARALLGCHSLRVRAAQQHLLKQHSTAGGDPDGVEYSGGLAQRTFLAIGAAVEDVRAVFPSNLPPPSAAASSSSFSSSTTSGGTKGRGGSSSKSTGEMTHGSEDIAAAMLPAVSALLVEWAAEEARQCGALLRRHALTPFATTGAAVGALLCCGLALVFCATLELSHGLALRAVFQEELWPQIEAIVRRHLQRLRDEAAAAASLDATNAALQALASATTPPAAAAGPSGSSSGAPLLPDLATGQQQSPSPAMQIHLPVLFPLPGAIATPPAAAAGLTSLPMLLPELRALAEGLAPLASVHAVAVLRSGVMAAFGAVCEQVHGSLARLKSSNAGAGGRDVATHGSLLATYVSKAERHLRAFAEADVQVALEPLGGLIGPVAPPELLLPSLEPITELLASLPQPAPEPQPSAPQQQQPAAVLLQPQSSSGLMDRICAELEADRRERERDGRRSKVRPLSSSQDGGVGAPGVAVVARAGEMGAGEPQDEEEEEEEVTAAGRGLGGAANKPESAEVVAKQRQQSVGREGRLRKAAEGTRTQPGRLVRFEEEEEEEDDDGSEGELAVGLARRRKEEGAGRVVSTADTSTSTALRRPPRTSTEEGAAAAAAAVSSSSAAAVTSGRGSGETTTRAAAAPAAAAAVTAAEDAAAVVPRRRPQLRQWGADGDDDATIATAVAAQATAAPAAASAEAPRSRSRGRNRPRPAAEGEDWQETPPAWGELEPQRQQQPEQHPKVAVAATAATPTRAEPVVRPKAHDEGYMSRAALQAATAGTNRTTRASEAASATVSFGSSQGSMVSRQRGQRQQEQPQDRTADTMAPLRGRGRLAEGREKEQEKEVEEEEARVQQLQPRMQRGRFARPMGRGGLSDSDGEGATAEDDVLERWRRRRGRANAGSADTDKPDAADQAPEALRGPPRRPLPPPLPAQPLSQAEVRSGAAAAAAGQEVSSVGAGGSSGEKPGGRRARQPAADAPVASDEEETAGGSVPAARRTVELPGGVEGRQTAALTARRTRNTDEAAAAQAAQVEEEEQAAAPSSSRPVGAGAAGGAVVARPRTAAVLEGTYGAGGSGARTGPSQTKKPANRFGVVLSDDDEEEQGVLRAARGFRGARHAGGGGSRAAAAAGAGGAAAAAAAEVVKVVVVGSAGVDARRVEPAESRPAAVERGPAAETSSSSATTRTHNHDGGSISVAAQSPSADVATRMTGRRRAVPAAATSSGDEEAAVPTRPLTSAAAPLAGAHGRDGAGRDSVDPDASDGNTVSAGTAGAAAAAEASGGAPRATTARERLAARMAAKAAAAEGRN